MEIDQDKSFIRGDPETTRNSSHREVAAQEKTWKTTKTQERIVSLIGKVVDNYNAIEIPYTDAIPSDYDGIMGVPISFLDKYSPDQFDIVGMCENEDLYKLKTKVYTTDECKQAYIAKFGKKGTYDLNASGVVIRNGLYEKVYQRVLIKHKGK